MSCSTPSSKSRKSLFLRPVATAPLSSKMVTGICTSSTFVTIGVCARICAHATGPPCSAHRYTNRTRKNRTARFHIEPPNLAPLRQLYLSARLLSMLLRILCRTLNEVLPPSVSTRGLETDFWTSGSSLSFLRQRNVAVPGRMEVPERTQALPALLPLSVLLVSARKRAVQPPAERRRCEAPYGSAAVVLPCGSALLFLGARKRWRG